LEILFGNFYANSIKYYLFLFSNLIYFYSSLILLDFYYLSNGLLFLTFWELDYKLIISIIEFYDSFIGDYYIFSDFKGL